MTEDEAKTKTCHKTLALMVEALSGEVSHFHPQACIGSACMAWRWDDYEQTDGFCGLAGRPPRGPHLAGTP